MSHKKKKTSFNPNVEKALLKLNFPLINNIGSRVDLKTSESTHSRSRHISKQYHGLTEKDIKQVPITLLKPDYVTKDPKVKQNKNYYKKRKGGKILFLKIVTKIVDLNKEEIVTIFTTNNIKS